MPGWFGPTEAEVLQGARTVVGDGSLDRLGRYQLRAGLRWAIAGASLACIVLKYVTDNTWWFAGALALGALQWFTDRHLLVAVGTSRAVSFIVRPGSRKLGHDFHELWSDHVEELGDGAWIVRGHRLKTVPKHEAVLRHVACLGETTP